MRVGIIGIPGRWSSERIADGLEARTGHRLLVDLADVAVDLETGRARSGGVRLDELDGLVVKKIGPDYSHDILDRLEVLHFLARRGLRVFSRPERIVRAVDRLACTLDLRVAGLPIPATVVTESVDEALDTVARFGRAVFKPLFTSKARGMVVVEEGHKARDAISAFRAAHPVMYVQQLVDIPGKDIGLVFLGGDYVGTYARVGRGDSWSTTTHFGGHYEAASPSQEIIDMAAKAQDVFGLDFTCVDVAETPDGPVVFEVSAFGGFRGLLAAHDIDAAELYADYVLAQLGEDGEAGA